MTQLRQGASLELTDAFPGETEVLGDLLERTLLAVEAEPQTQDRALTLVEDAEAVAIADDGDHQAVVGVGGDAEVDGKLADTLKDPMELAVAPDGRVFFAQRDGMVKLIKPGAKESIVLAKLPVFTGLEDGMLGITLDPNFAQNNWVYLNRSLPDTITDAKTGGKAGIIRVARFTLKGDALDLASEKTILEVQTQREQCCHVGGSLAFEARNPEQRGWESWTPEHASRSIDPQLGPVTHWSDWHDVTDGVVTVRLE